VYGTGTAETVANPFTGYYEKGRFIAQKACERGPHIYWCAMEIKSIAKHFPLGRSLPGLSEQGLTVAVVIDSVLSPKFEDPLDSSFKVRVRSKAGTRPATTVLFWTPNVKVQYLRPITARLPAAADVQLRKKVSELWKEALTVLPEDARPTSMVLGSPIVQTIPGAKGILSVLFPATIPDSYLRSASFFFIYSLSSQRIVYSTFGHGEWSPNATLTQVLTVKPIAHFRIGKDPKVYFFGEYTGGWESFGFAIFDLRTGDALLSWAFDY